MEKQIILSRHDYLMVSSLIESKYGFTKFCSDKLREELRHAKVINGYELPQDVVRINSTVKVLEVESNQPLTFTLVKPALSNIKESKISYTAPLAAALIGYQKGDTVRWKMPSGFKNFRIVDVINS